MTDLPDVQTVDVDEEYYHVQFRDPDGFPDIQTPGWAQDDAASVSDGARVRTGRVGGSDKWKVQSVLVAVDAVDDEAEARTVARRIGEEVEP